MYSRIFVLYTANKCIHNCNPPLLKCDTEYIGQCSIIRAAVATSWMSNVRGGGRFRLVISSLAQAMATVTAPHYNIVHCAIQHWVEPFHYRPYGKTGAEKPSA